MDLTKLKTALLHAAKVDTVRQKKKKASGHKKGDSATDIPPFSIDVDAVYTAAASLWSSDTAVASSIWPAKATAAMNISSLLSISRSFTYDNDPASKETQSMEYYLQDEDGVLKVLVEAGLAQRFVELLLLPNNAAQAKMPPELEDVFGFDSSLTLTSSTALKFYVCQVRKCGVSFIIMLSRTIIALGVSLNEWTKLGVQSGRSFHHAFA